LFIGEAEQEDADASLHWTRRDYAARADVEGQRACQRSSGLIKAQKLMEVVKLSKAMTEINAQVEEKATRDSKAAVIELSRRDSPKWHMRLAVDNVNCLRKTFFLVLFCALYFLHPRWVFASFVVCVFRTNLGVFHPSSS
jgi:hypothetical protein